MAGNLSLWWDMFLLEHGRDSQEETAFLGYLSTNNIPASAAPQTLAEAYIAYLAFIAASAAL
jgi:hypothetical protein